MSLDQFLKTPDRVQNKQTEDFINGASKRVEALAPPKEKTLGVLFKLPPDVDREVHRMMGLPRDFKSTRSDVAILAISILGTLPDKEIIEGLRKVKNEY